MSNAAAAEDVSDLIQAHKYRLSLTKPRQSNFRVVAILFYELSDDDNDTSERHTVVGTNDEPRHSVVGTNDEPCTMSGSLCAERAAILQLRFVPNVTHIRKAVIVTDSSQPISPGMLCREFLSSHVAVDRAETDIVLGSSVCARCGLDVSEEDDPAVLEGRCDGNNSSTNAPHDFRRIRTNMLELYPHPSPYVRLSAKEAEEMGSQYMKDKAEECREAEERLEQALSSARLQTVADHDELDQDLHYGRLRYSDEKAVKGLTPIVPKADEVLLLVGSADQPQNERKACCLKREDAGQYLLKLAREASAMDSKSALHPLRYGAAVLYSDGTTSVAYQKKALEYGATLDAVCQLAPAIEDKGRERGCPRPVLLAQADQFGILHSPFAPARAYLSEHGYSDCCIAIHPPTEEERVTSEISLVTVEELAPSSPDMFNDAA